MCLAVSDTRKLLLSVDEVIIMLLKIYLSQRNHNLEFYVKFTPAIKASRSYIANSSCTVSMVAVQCECSITHAVNSRPIVCLI